MSYSLGNVKPWVAAVANEVGPKYGIRTIYGYSYRTIDGGSVLSDHALGLALDFMCDIPTGDKLAAYVQSNAGRLNVTYIIHNRRIWSVARSREGWRVYDGRNPHTDHVHVSFLPKPGTGGTVAQPVSSVPLPIPGGGVLPIPSQGGAGDAIKGGVGAAKDTYKALKALSDMATFLINPNSWIRVLMFMAGLLLLATAISMLVKNQRGLVQAAETAGNIAKNSRAPVKVSTQTLANGNEVIKHVAKGSKTLYKG